MEAATPLRQSQVSAVGGRLTVTQLVVEDETAARLVRERAEAGDDPAATVVDAIEIGARVLDREQVGANAEFVRTEFEKAARELDVAFTERARKVAEHLGDKVEEVFAPDDGQLAREFEKLFSDGSAASVQNRVRELVGEALVRSREEMVRQFSTADGNNPLADFKASTIRELEKGREVQQGMVDRVAQLEKQLLALRADREKQEELAGERERGTAKGRTYEEQVAEAIDAIAVAQGDCSEAVGDLTGASGKTGDVVVSIAAASGPVRGRIVFEAKNSRLTAPKAREQLERALEQRDADFAVLVVPSDEDLPAKQQPLREYNGDKLLVSYDPEDGSPLALEVGYRLARARVLMERAESGDVDAAAVREQVERALHEMAEVRKVKSQLTAAKGSIDNAYGGIDVIAARVRACLEQIDSLVLPGERGSAAQPSLGEL